MSGPIDGKTLPRHTTNAWHSRTSTTFMMSTSHSRQITTDGCLYRWVLAQMTLPECITLCHDYSSSRTATVAACPDPEVNLLKLRSLVLPSMSIIIYNTMGKNYTLQFFPLDGVCILLWCQIISLNWYLVSYLVQEHLNVYHSFIHSLVRPCSQSVSK